MKKLMIAAAIVCAAAMSQAAAYTWAAAKSYTYVAGSTSDKAAGTAYLFNVNTMSEKALLDAFVSGGTDWSAALAKSVNPATMAGGQVRKTDTFTYDGEASGTWQSYFAIVDGDNIYISTEKGAQVTELAAGYDIAFDSQKTPSQKAASTWTKGGTFSDAGWYTAAVPEPTSGLLLLLGVAGLALRRRRA